MHFLEADWWQGVAGIAQILAAFFTVIAILQARKMIKQAEAERRFSVAPDWDVMSNESVNSSRESGIRIAEICFHNTGLGLARKPKCEFVPANGNQPRSISCDSWRGSGRPVRAGGLLNVNLPWEDAKPLDGILIVTCETQFGETLTKKFRLRTWLRDDAHNSSCEVEPESDSGS